MFSKRICKKWLGFITNVIGDKYVVDRDKKWWVLYCFRDRRQSE